MSVFFSGRDLINIAIGIEKNGAAFYDTMAASRQNSETYSLYKYLAEQELEHIKRFQNMLNKNDDYEPSEIFTPEYEQYMKALIDSSVFTDESTSRARARNAGSDLEAIHTAVDAEKDSILFYMELSHSVRKPDRDVILKIIEEEKSHIRQLADIKNQLASKH